MKNIQEVFNQIQVMKKQQKEIKSAFRDAMLGSTEHKELTEQIKAMKEKKKQVETAIREEFSKELDKLDELKIELDAQNMMLNDIALTTMMNGEEIEIVDAYNNAYEPVFMVKFKKTNVIKNENTNGMREDAPKNSASTLPIMEINPSME